MTNRIKWTEDFNNTHQVVGLGQRLHSIQVDHRSIHMLSVATKVGCDPTDEAACRVLCVLEW